LKKFDQNFWTAASPRTSKSAPTINEARDEAIAKSALTINEARGEAAV
jgi:hypothetical protein